MLATFFPIAENRYSSAKIMALIPVMEKISVASSNPDILIVRDVYSSQLFLRPLHQEQFSFERGGMIFGVGIEDQ